MQVRVYRNLREKKFSILAKTPKGWRLWKHSIHVILDDARFKVSRAGRERVIREKRKNVHAYVQGSFLESVLPENNAILSDGRYRSFTYDPYKNETFVDKLDGRPVNSARRVVFHYGVGCFYK